MAARTRSFRPGARFERSASPGSNAILAWLLVVFLILVPLPLGSNRPLFWAINAAVVAGIGLVYATIWLLRGRTIGIGLRDLGLLPWAFALLCIYLLAQLVPGLPTLSSAPGATFLMLLRTLTYGLLFFLLLQVARNPERTRLMLDVLLATSVGYAILALAMLRAGDTLLGYEKTAYLGSATGTFVNRNSFATMLAFGCVLAFARLLHDIRQAQAPRDPYSLERPWIRVAIDSLALVAIVATLIATQSRMGVAAAVMGLAVVAIRNISSPRLPSLPAILAGFVVLLLLAFVTWLNSEGLLQRFMFTDQSWSERVALYRQVIDLIIQRPLTGFGGGSFQLAFQAVHAPPAGIDRVWDKAHNSYLTLFAELGLPAGLLIPLMVAGVTTRLLRTPRATSDNLPITIALGVLAVGATHSLVDFSLEIQAVTLWFVAFLAFGLAQSINAAEIQSALDEPDSGAR